MKAQAILKRLSKSLFSHWFVIGVVFVIGFGAFTFTRDSQAANILGLLTAPDTAVESVVGFIAGGMAFLLGRLLIIIIQALLFVAKYNDFISSPAVSLGWIIMRDMANMFFVFLLLAIAVGTILQQEKYSYSKLLPGLIIAAILVNFSKTIAGVIIDISQVVMNTFVSAFADAAGGNFAELLGIAKYMKLIGEGGVNDVRSTAFALVLALIFTLIALIVVSAITGMLIMRIVGLWFLVVLSPWAYVLSLNPQGEKYAKQWWNSFTNLVLLGPVIAFFLWLSLAVVAQVNGQVDDISKASTAGLLGSQVSEVQNLSDVQAAGTEIGTFQGVLGYFLGIGMLLATMMAATELGNGGGQMAKEWTGNIMGWAYGKKGASPMRFAKERFDAYQGSRAKLRKDRAAKGGEALSTLQDRIRGRIPLNDKGSLEARKRASEQKEKALTDSVALLRKANGYDAKNASELTGIAKTGNQRERIAALQILADKGKINANDTQLIDALKGVQAATKGMEIGKKIGTDVKTKNFDAAWATDYDNGSEKGQQKFIEDVQNKKVNQSSLTKDQWATIKASNADFGADVIKGVRDAGDVSKILGGFQEEIREDMGKDITANDLSDANGYNKDIRIAFGKGTGNFVGPGAELAEHMAKSAENTNMVLKHASSETWKGDAGEEKMAEILGHEKINISNDSLKNLSEETRAAMSKALDPLLEGANAPGAQYNIGKDVTKARSMYQHLTGASTYNVPPPAGAPAGTPATKKSIYDASRVRATMAGAPAGTSPSPEMQAYRKHIRKATHDSFKKQAALTGPITDPDNALLLETIAQEWGIDKLKKLRDEADNPAFANQIFEHMKGDPKFDRKVEKLERDGYIV